LSNWPMLALDFTLRCELCLVSFQMRSELKNLYGMRGDLRCAGICGVFWIAAWGDRIGGLGLDRYIDTVLVRTIGLHGDCADN
jgi:hypothetical protein